MSTGAQIILCLQKSIGYYFVLDMIIQGWCAHVGSVALYVAAVGGYWEPGILCQEGPQLERRGLELG